MLGDRLRIRFTSEKHGGKTDNNGYWYLRAIDPDDHAKGWRLTYKITSGTGDEITCGQPIEGFDPKQGVELLMGFIYQEVVDTHNDIVKRVEHYHTFSPQDQLCRSNLPPRETLGEMLSKEIRCWHMVIPDLMQEYHKIREAIPARGWPGIEGESFPWEKDPSLIPHRSPAFKIVWDERNRLRNQAKKAKRKR